MSETYYKVIDGNKYDRGLLEAADAAVAGQGDGRISVSDAETLFAQVEDGNTYTDIEKNTMAYIRENYNFTDAADGYLRGVIRSWAAIRGHQNRS